MPTLIRLSAGAFLEVEDDVLDLADGEAPRAGEGAPVSLVSLARFQQEGAAWLDQGLGVGVRLLPHEAVEALAYDLPRLALVALEFPKFRDGRAYSSAALLRERLGYGGEVRAVGEVMREQAFQMVRCGFDAFAVSDGSTAQAFAEAAMRFRHVYQASADRRAPAFLERI